MTVLVVVGITVALGLIALVALDLVGRCSQPLDTERQEQWFVGHAPAPVRRVLRSADRRVAGGAALMIVFTILLSAAAAVGWIFDSIDQNRWFASWDESAAEWGSDHVGPTSTDLLEAVTQFGATGWLLITMAIVGAVESWRFRRLGVVGYLAVVGVGVSILNNGLKHLVQRERPAVNPLTSFGGYSFPSGHTAAAAACWAAIALVLARRSSRPVRTLAALLAALITIGVAASRVLLGVHWVTDVIAGVVTGWAWFMLVTLVFGGRILRFGEPADRVAAHTTQPAPADRNELETTQ